MSRVVLQPKTSDSTKKYVFDFLSQLAVGETISTATTTATTYSGNDASPSSVVSGAASISGTQVTQALTAGTVGCVYTLKCAITTSTSQTLSLYAYLAIEPNLS